MSKRRAKSNAITTAPANPNGITTGRGGRPATTGSPASTGMKGWLVTLGLILLALAGIWFFHRDSDRGGPLGGRRQGRLDGQVQRENKPRSLDDLLQLALASGKGKPDNWKPEAWKPVKPEDLVVDRFVALHKKGDPAAMKLLAGLPADDAVINEVDFERRATDHFLRNPGLKIVDIWKGDLGPDGKPRPAPGRFILVTKGSVSSPVFQVKDAGLVSPRQNNVHNPDLVVDVRAGVIHGVRAEMHKAP
jgi:hypothetical protein